MDGALDSTPADGFQPHGHAWDPMRPDIVDLLKHSRECDVQPIYYGSNHTFLVTLTGGEAGTSLAVYKPARGEYPLYDFPNETLYKREVGTWLVDRILGWNLVPPTVVTRGRYGVGSLQLYIEATSQGEVELVELQRLALLDLMINNADRKGEHLLLGQEGKLWGIDHGLTFHMQPKLRTVLWHFAGQDIPQDERADIERLLAALERRSGPDVRQLVDLISQGEWKALVGRVRRLVDAGVFPDPRYKPVPYRW